VDLHRLKRLVRPLIPDVLMARYRLAQHSRVVRTNVDLFLADPVLRRRWLRVTPDTVRVRPPPGEGGTGRPDVVVHALGEVGLDPNWYLGVDGVEVVIGGVLGPPRLQHRRRGLPGFTPRLVATTREAFDEVGGRPEGDRNLVGLCERLAAAGRTVGLVAVEGEPDPFVRVDPVTRPAAVVIAGVPLHDVGGGSRTAQMALELVRQGFHVTVLWVFPADESIDLGLRFVHPHLEERSLTSFDRDAFRARVVDPRLVIVALPHPAAVECAFELQTMGFAVVYDLIDDWGDRALGGEWFRPEVERRLVAGARALVASAPDLVEHLQAIGAPRPILVPNAVNTGIFGRPPGPPPEDLPGGDGPILGYHGSLYGDWFDWPAVRMVAEGHPDARVVLIGDPPDRIPELPANVWWLGLKAQHDLPDYVDRFDVGLIPFELTDTTHAVSPLKAYEYLAMGVPIAAPPLRSLDGLPHAHTSRPLTAAVASALAEGRFDGRPYLAEHGWSRRVAVVLDAAGIEAPPTGGTPVRVVSRPVVHHADRLRAP
jgi:glycosyltransferase involved in cell wall biosynthesis